MKLNIGDIVIEYYEENHLATFVVIGKSEETETQLAMQMLKNIDTGKIWKVHALKHFGGGRFKIIKAP